MLIERFDRYWSTATAGLDAEREEYRLGFNSALTFLGCSEQENGEKVTLTLRRPFTGTWISNQLPPTAKNCFAEWCSIFSSPTTTITCATMVLFSAQNQKAGA